MWAAAVTAGLGRNTVQTITDRDAFAINGFPVLLGWIVVLGVAP